MTSSRIIHFPVAMALRVRGALSSRVLHNHAVRFMSSEGAIASTSAAPSSIASVPVSTPPPPPAAPVVIKRGSSLVDRLWAFFAGVGVGGVVGYFKLSEDILESTAEIDTRIIGLRADVGNSNEALRRRVATLEHQIQEIQDRLQ